jgi:YHS domain-containing protein
MSVPSGPVVDPEFALFHMRMALWDPVDPDLLGSLKPELQARVNGEVYRFGGPATLRRFRAAPALYCGMLRDPVSGARFWPSTHSPNAEWDGGPYYFASDSTRLAFQRDPRRYEVKRRM